jgi:hypothetical protein
LTMKLAMIAVSSTNRPVLTGLDMTARDASCRCCATESATSFRASRLSSSVVARNVVSAGTSASRSAVGD